MNSSRLIAIVAILFALNFGYSFATPLIRTLFSAYTSQNWPQTNGTVVRAEVQLGSKGRPYALVEYGYAVNRHEYQSSRIAFMGLDEGAGSPQEVTSLYPVGKAVTVFFNPREPDEAVLRPGLHSYIPLVLLGVGLLVVASSLLAMLRIFRRSSRATAAAAAADSVQ